MKFVAGTSCKEPIYREASSPKQAYIRLLKAAKAKNTSITDMAVLKDGQYQKIDLTPFVRRQYA